MLVKPTDWGIPKTSSHSASTPRSHFWSQRYGAFQALPWNLVLCAPLLAPTSSSKMLTHVSFDPGNVLIFTRRRNCKVFRQELGLLLPPKRAFIRPLPERPRRAAAARPQRAQTAARAPCRLLIGNGSETPLNVSLPFLEGARVFKRSCIVKIHCSVKRARHNPMCKAGRRLC